MASRLLCGLFLVLCVNGVQRSKVWSPDGEQLFFPNDITLTGASADKADIKVYPGLAICQRMQFSSTTDILIQDFEVFFHKRKNLHTKATNFRLALYRNASLVFQTGDTVVGEYIIGSQPSQGIQLSANITDAEIAYDYTMAAGDDWMVCVGCTGNGTHVTRTVPDDYGNDAAPYNKQKKLPDQQYLTPFYESSSTRKVTSFELVMEEFNDGGVERYQFPAAFEHQPDDNLAWLRTGGLLSGTSSTTGALRVYVRGTPFDVDEFPFEEDFTTWEGLGYLCPGQCSSVDLRTPLHPEYPTTCNLPYGWINDQSDDFDWIMYNDAVPSRASFAAGPGGDASGVAGGGYMYTETTFPCGSNTESYTANLISPLIQLQTKYVTTGEFQYHMFGRAGANLHLDVHVATFGSDYSNTGTWDLDIIPAIADNNDTWAHTTFNLDAYVGKDIRLRFRETTGFGIADGGFENDIGLDGFKLSALTTTPSPTETASATPSPTITTSPTLTVIPTATADPTATASTTDTQTVIRLYEPIGIPDPDPVYDRGTTGIVEKPFLSFSPDVVRVNEQFTITMSGYWFYTDVNKVTCDDSTRTTDPIYVKIASHKENCLSMAEGSTEAVVSSPHETVSFTITDMEHSPYMVCVKHRLNWEEVRSPLLHVVPEDPTRLHYGYSSCKQMAATSGTHTSVCGCYYHRMAANTTATHNVELEYPTVDMIPSHPQRTTSYESGCCRRGVGLRQPMGVPADDLSAVWGTCTEGAQVTRPTE